MSKVDSWLPLYVADYRADTTRLSTEQHGAYLLLIMDYWRNGSPPNDDRVLAQITGLPLSRWKAHRSVIQPYFAIEGGKWRHGRIEKELTKARNNNLQKSEAGKASAAKRWGNGNGNDEITDVTTDATTADVTATQRQNAPSPSPTQSSLPAPSPSPPPAPITRARKRAAIRPDSVSEKVWNDFNEIRKAKRAPLTDTALEGIEREAEKAGMTLQSALETACARGWQGFEAAWLSGTKTHDSAGVAAEAKRRIFGDNEKDITNEAERL
jgi:uncharacterized protein YdaU (DUF1376 family)